MSSTPRTRAQMQGSPSGTLTFNGVTDVSDRLILDRFITDIVNVPSKSGALLDIKSWRSHGGFFNSDGYGRSTNNWTPLLYRNTRAVQSAHLPFSSRPTDSSLATSLMKRANLETTSFNAPLFLFELRELPKLLLQAKTLIVSPKPRNAYPKELGSLWLQAQFGWRPFLSDLLSMITFADSINERATRFKKVYDKGGTTVKRSLFKGTTTKSFHQSFANSALLVVDASVAIESRLEVSGYVKYVPKHSTPVTDADILKQAKSTFLGLNHRPADLWDAFPWTWMVDYFLNVGDFIAAHQGNLYFDVSEFALMERGTSIYKAKYHTFIDVPDPYVNIYETKRRWKPPLSIDANFDMPFLTAYQASILGSLLLTR